MKETTSRLPDFLIIGAPKAGTTALFRAMGRHPDIFFPELKEPSYFTFADLPPGFAGPGGDYYARQFIYDEQAYRELFAQSPSTALIGEASALYLSCQRAPILASRYLPHARLIATLRHPVERAYSQFLHVRQEGNEPCAEFEEAWRAGEERMKEGWVPGTFYNYRSFYGKALSRWLQHFPREQLLILWYEEWCREPEKVLDQIWRHLGVEPLANPLVTRENVSSVQPRWAWLHHRMIEDNALRRWAQRRLPLALRDAVTVPLRLMNLQPALPLDPAVRARLAVTYHEDIAQVEALTGRDLSAWRS
jgi:Sulfotransferase family